MSMKKFTAITIMVMCLWNISGLVFAMDSVAEEQSIGIEEVVYNENSTSPMVVVLCFDSDIGELLKQQVYRAKSGEIVVFEAPELTGYKIVEGYSGSLEVEFGTDVITQFWYVAE